jgi:hypothetical protein
MEVDKISCKIMELIIELKGNMVKIFEKSKLENKILKARKYIINFS